MFWSRKNFPLFISSFSSVITLFFVLGRLEAVESTTQQHESAIQATNQAISGLAEQIVGVQREQRDTTARVDEVQREIGETVAKLGDVEGEKVET